MDGNREIGIAPIYNLKAVVMETGLKPPTIRAWERRYGVPQPQRTEGGHRQYSERDIEILKWLLARQEEGISISHATEMWHTLTQQGVDPLRPEPAVPSYSAGVASRTLPELGLEIAELRKEWVDACLNFDRQAAEYALTRAFALFSPERVASGVLQKGLAEVGQGWYRGDVSVQQEHFTSALSTQRLEMLIAAAPPPTRPERILVASAEGDYHAFSPLLLTYYLRRSGWDVIYLGANVPNSDLERTVAQIQPDLVILAAQRLHTAAAIVDAFQVLQGQGVMIAYGGLVFNQFPDLSQRIPGHFLGPTIEGAVEKIASLLSSKKSPALAQMPMAEHTEVLAQFSSRRPLIEAHVRETLEDSSLATSDLEDINEETAQIITAVLKLGDPSLMNPNMDWLKHVLRGYRLSEPAIRDYVGAYAQALRIYLGPDAALIVDWLTELSDSQPEITAVD